MDAFEGALGEAPSLLSLDAVEDMEFPVRRTPRLHGFAFLEGRRGLFETAALDSLICPKRIVLKSASGLPVLVQFLVGGCKNVF